MARNMITKESKHVLYTEATIFFYGGGGGNESSKKENSKGKDILQGDHKKLLLRG